MIKVRQVQLLVCLTLFSLSVSCSDAPAPSNRHLAEHEQDQFNSPLNLGGWPEPGSWPQFAHDPLHSGRTDVDLVSSDLEEIWQFRPTNHIWSYKEGYSVWSSPVVGTMADRPLVIAGHYDGVVYAVDGLRGLELWSFRPGGRVFASPVLGHLNEKAMVFLVSDNGSVYGLDAVSGRELWSFSTLAWSFTQAESDMSSPTLVRDGVDWTLVVGVWNSDRSATQNVQLGEVIALNAVDGSLRWRRRLSSVPITSPAVAHLDGETLVFVTAHHGGMWALHLRDGSTKWQRLLNEETRSSPSIAVVADAARLFVGTRFHSIYCVDPLSGAKWWRRQMGNWIDGTPSWCIVEGGTRLVVGSYDRTFYCLSGSEGRRQWQHTTGNFAYSSAIWAKLAGKPVVVAMSWDEWVYMLDGVSGVVLWKARSEPLIWSHTSQGSSLWASPVVAKIGDQPRLLVPALDGVLYAYGPRGI